MNTEILESLTGAQRAAVTHIDGPMLVVAGPGSGKTRVVTHRVANLIEKGIDPKSILALTFTNKAADEMRRRLSKLTSAEGLWIGTFHRFCAQQLRKYADHVGLESNYTIYDAGDSKRALKRAIESTDLDSSFIPFEGLVHAISQTKSRLITADQYRPAPGSDIGPILQKVYPAYQSQLLRANAVDFDDLLLHVAVMLRESSELRAML
ncbi:MAG: UvrD-helicase domain-containing protein, partial [Planctomycetales bacterium]|nr:UvrD-helicase domain-containing protein [Planctomycetales bacterium]